jgi:hypothetical protein
MRGERTCSRVKDKRVCSCLAVAADGGRPASSDRSPLAPNRTATISEPSPVSILKKKSGWRMRRGSQAPSLAAEHHRDRLEVRCPQVHPGAVQIRPVVRQRHAQREVERLNALDDRGVTAAVFSK